MQPTATALSQSDSAFSGRVFCVSSAHTASNLSRELSEARKNAQRFFLQDPLAESRSASPPGWLRTKFGETWDAAVFIDDIAAGSECPPDRSSCWDGLRVWTSARSCLEQVESLTSSRYCGLYVATAYASSSHLHPSAARFLARSWILHLQPYDVGAVFRTKLCNMYAPTIQEELLNDLCLLTTRLFELLPDTLAKNGDGLSTALSLLLSARHPIASQELLFTNLAQRIDGKVALTGGEIIREWIRSVWDLEKSWRLSREALGMNIEAALCSLTQDWASPLFPMILRKQQTIEARKLQESLEITLTNEEKGDGDGNGDGDGDGDKANENAVMSKSIFMTEALMESVCEHAEATTVPHAITEIVIELAALCLSLGLRGTRPIIGVLPCEMGCGLPFLAPRGLIHLVASTAGMGYCYTLVHKIECTEKLADSLVAIFVRELRSSRGQATSGGASTFKGILNHVHIAAGAGADGLAAAFFAANLASDSAINALHRRGMIPEFDSQTRCDLNAFVSRLSLFVTFERSDLLWKSWLMELRKLAPSFLSRLRLHTVSEGAWEVREPETFDERDEDEQQTMELGGILQESGLVLSKGLLTRLGISDPII